MPDVLTPKQRSFNMSRIRGSNTSPERAVRAGLRAAGVVGYRIHSSLLGKPDVVFPKARLVVFIDGCFWHRCPVDYREPSTRQDFWRKKIEGNVARDRQVNRILASKGWKIMRIWEHEVKEQPEKVVRNLIEQISKPSQRRRRR